MNYEASRLETKSGVARITLARPESDNAIDARLLRELEAASEAIASSDDVRVVLLTADGPSFCAGWDAALRDELIAARTADPAAPEPFAPLAALSMPVIAALRGTVASVGLELALVCDIRIAADDAIFAMPDIELGLSLAGGTQRLARTIGRGRALSMLLLGETLDAEAAYRAGLVGRVVPAGSLEAEMDALAQTIASRGPIAVRYAKELLRRGPEITLDQAMRYETDLSVILQTTADRAEGVRAFLEKRAPEFDGK